MLPTVIFLNPGNSEVVKVTQLKDKETGDFLVAATVKATLYDRRGIADPVFKDITLTYVPSTDATYVGSVSSDFNAVLGGGYTIVVIATSVGLQSKYSIPAIVQLRRQ